MRGQVSGLPEAFVTWGDHELYHAGNAQVRAGSVSTTTLDTAVAVMFSNAFAQVNYEVFLQTQSNVSTIAYPSDKTVNGFTLNLSIGVNAVFSYLAIEII